MATSRSPKNPYRVEINYDKPLEFGNVSSYTGESVENVLHLAIGEIKRNNTSAYIRIWHNDAGFPNFDWQIVSEAYYKANGTLDVSRNIGVRISAIRRERGMTQQELADKSGILRPNIARIENGRYGMTVDVLARIANTLGCELAIIEKPST